MKKHAKLITLTIIFFFLSHYLSVFAHEYAHAVTAWLLGYKSNPLDLNYGGLSPANLLLLMNIDQNINNNVIYSLGHPWHVALIALAGPCMTLLLYFLSYSLMQKNNIGQRHSYLLYFLFFLNMWCLGGTYSYVPVRTFTPSGNMVDILDIEQSLHLSPWTIYFFVGYLVVYMFWQFFTKTLIQVYKYGGISSTFGRASLMTFCVLVLFGYCGLAGLVRHGEVSHFIAVTSVYAIPGLLILLWPRRAVGVQQ